MSTREAFTDAEWTQIISAPPAVIAAVIGSSLSGPVAIMREVDAAVKTFERAAEERRNNPLMASLLLTLKGHFDAFMGKGTADNTGGSIDFMGLGMNPELALETIRSAADLLTARAGATGDEVRTWMLELAHAVANAAHEGGFMGMGGEQVNEQERAMIASITAALGLEEREAGG